MGKYTGDDEDGDLALPDKEKNKDQEDEDEPEHDPEHDPEHEEDPEKEKDEQEAPNCDDDEACKAAKKDLKRNLDHMPKIPGKDEDVYTPDPEMVKVAR